MFVYSQLRRAQLENLGSDPSAGIAGRIWLNTGDNTVRVDVDGTNIRSLLLLNSSSQHISTLTPAANDTYDLGTTSNRFRHLYLSGNADIQGNITLGGSITLGDADTDSIVVNAELDSSLIPDDDNTHDLGSSSKQWSRLYLGTALNAGGTEIAVAEIAYLDGVTSAIQTQLDAKLDDFSGSTDNALVRTNGTGGDSIQESSVTVDDDGNLILGAGDKLRLQGSSSGNIELLAPATISTPYDIEFPDSEAASAGEAIVVSSISGNKVSTQWGAAGDASWQMQDAGSGQIRFKGGSRVVNGIVQTIASDITTNATVVAITDDTLTTVDASNGFLYEASDTIRIWTFYDIIDDEFKAIGNSTDDTKFDYRLDANNQAFIDAGINLARHVPIGYVDVTASGSPGTVSVSITNFPVGPWTTFNNVAAAESWQDSSATLGNGTNASLAKYRYRRVGNRVEFYGRVEWSGSGSGSTFTLTMPGGIAPSANLIQGNDAINIGSAHYQLSSTFSTVDSIAMIYDGAGGVLSFFEDGGTLTGADMSSGGFVDFNGSYEIDAADGYNPIAVGFPDITDMVQTKSLSADVNTDTSTLSDLTVTVEVGKTYEVWMNPAFQVDTDASLIMECNHNGSTIGIVQVGAEAHTDFFRLSKYIAPFVATASTITFELSSTGGNPSNILRGNGTTVETHIVVREIPQTGLGVLLDIPQGRVVASGGNGYGSTDTKIRRYSSATTTGTAITYAESAANGSTFTVNKSGAYNITRHDLHGSSYRIGISRNSNQLTSNIELIDAEDRVLFQDIAGNQVMPQTRTMRLNAGDVIRAHDATALSNTSAVNVIFIIEAVGV